MEFNYIYILIYGMVMLTFIFYSIFILFKMKNKYILPYENITLYFVRLIIIGIIYSVLGGIFASFGLGIALNLITNPDFIVVDASKLFGIIFGVLFAIFPLLAIYNPLKMNLYKLIINPIKNYKTKASCK